MNTQPTPHSPPSPSIPLDVYAAWILLLSWAVLSGWILSLACGLNRLGYTLALVPLVALAIVKRGAMASLLGNITRHVRQFARRCTRQPLPALFALTTLAATLGGFLYEPNNYDFLAYRLPRMLRWWDAGHWHWIHTSTARMNYSGTGMEWAMMPLFIFSLSSRLFFLVNIACYLLMPGLIFSIFTHLGVGRRTAWFWMWILPAGYCYAATAGGLCNDMFSTGLALAALHFGCRAARHLRLTDLWLGGLAAGLMTGVKASNLPLVLPFLVAAFPAWVTIRTRWAQTLGIACLAVALSFIPIAVLSKAYTGCWSGDPENTDPLKATDTLTALLGNGLQLAARSMTPPVFPMASTWNAHAMEFLPGWLRSRLDRDFPKFSLTMPELGNSEQRTGVGMGIILLGAISVGAALFSRRRYPPRSCRRDVLFAGSIAFLACCGLVAADSVPRYLMPYYPLAIATVLVLPGTAIVTRRLWWQRLAILMSTTALILVILSPSRPLWPSQAVSSALHAYAPSNRLAERISAVYSLYRNRADALAPARLLLPPETRIIGFIQSGGDPDISLWKPLGRRRVVDIVGSDMLHRPALDQMGIQTIVARHTLVTRQCDSIESWLSAIDGRLIATVDLVLTVAEGKQKWCIVKLNPPASTARQAP